MYHRGAVWSDIKLHRNCLSAISLYVLSRSVHNIKFSTRVLLYIKTTSPEHLLNQARAGLWPARAWFLNIVSVQTSVCVFCVCVSAPEAINN